MSCPKCGSHDWKFASVVHASGLSTIETNTVGLGVGANADVLGGSVGGGVGVARGSGTQQTELSKLAAPPVKVMRPAKVLVWLVVGTYLIKIIFARNATSDLGEVYLLYVAPLILALSIGRLAMTPHISKAIDEKHKLAMDEYATKKMCLKCGTLFYKEENDSQVQQDSPSPQAVNKPIENVVTANTKQCPYCAESIKVEAVLCKHCHSKL